MTTSSLSSLHKSKCRYFGILSLYHSSFSRILLDPIIFWSLSPGRSEMKCSKTKRWFFALYARNERIFSSPGNWIFQQEMKISEMRDIYQVSCKGNTLPRNGSLHPWDTSLIRFSLCHASAIPASKLCWLMQICIERDKIPMHFHSFYFGSPSAINPSLVVQG